MEIKRVEEYEEPKFNTFQLKTGKMLATGAACLALLGISSTGGCINSTTETLAGDIASPDFTVTTTHPVLTVTVGTSAPPDFTTTIPPQTTETTPTTTIAGGISVLDPTTIIPPITLPPRVPGTPMPGYTYIW